MAVFCHYVDTGAITRVLYRGPANIGTPVADNTPQDVLIEMELLTVLDDDNLMFTEEPRVRISWHSPNTLNQGRVYLQSLAPGAWARLVSALGLPAAQSRINRDLLPLIDVEKLVSEPDDVESVEVPWITLSRVLLPVET